MAAASGYHMQLMNKITGQKRTNYPHSLSVLLSITCVIYLGIIAGCGSLEKGYTKVDPFEKLYLEQNADPDEQPFPEEDLPPLSQQTPPSYTITRIPDIPPVNGTLNVPIKRDWRYIVIHHSGTRSGNAHIFDKYHREALGWLGVGYHFVIGNGHGGKDGQIEPTFRWTEQIHGAHAGVDKYNKYGIGICLVGNFDHSYPTEAQIKSLVSLVSYLQERCHIPLSEIYLHRHIKKTNCPGAHFPFYRFISLIEH
jgi:hypothetical protein